VVATHRALMLGHLAQRQHGVFTRRQAIQIGFTPGEVDGRVKRLEWVSVDRGVYRSAETGESWHQRVEAACLAGPAVASHRAAAALWQLAGFAPELVEVTAVRHRRRTTPGVVWHESVRLDEQTTTIIDGIPVTDATRTLLDLGAVVDLSELLGAIDDAVRRRLVSLDSLGHELARWDPRRRGSARVRRAVAARVGQPAPASVLETEFCALVEAFGLPRPCRQWRIRDDDGRVLARVDFAFPAARVVIEIDGLRFHGGPDDWQDDLKRQNAVMARGYRVLRFTAEDLRRRPDQVNATIRAALSVQDALLDPPGDGGRRNM
jgi:predicted transcriptional regulator of viral defense system